MPELKCVPDSITGSCDHQDDITVRVKTSPAQPNITIDAIGYSSTAITVTPKSGTTNQNGYVDFTIRCITCTGTDVTFDAQTGNYDTCELDVDCEEQINPPGSDSDTSFSFVPVTIPMQIVNSSLVMQKRTKHHTGNIIERDLEQKTENTHRHKHC